MRTFLVHTHSIGGHQLEYLHHIFMEALRRTNERFIFLIPIRFNEDSNRMIWPKASHIELVVMQPEDEVPLGWGILRKGWRNSRTIRKYASKYEATDVIVVSLMEYLPFLSFSLDRRIRVRGIVYRIYLYEWKTESFLKKCLDVLKYLLISHHRVYDRVMICNDTASAQYLNRLFDTEKFRYMPDPVGALPDYTGKDLRKELGISTSDTFFLHPGSMNAYKNTLSILKALCELDENSSVKPVVVFAGQVREGIQEEFGRLYREAEKHARLFHIKGYLSFETLADLFHSCDYVLIPYKIKSQSSGIVGHAAYYGKPVVAVKGGVVGKLVRKWRLGYLLEDSSAASICCFISESLRKSPESTKGNSYYTSHSIKGFCSSILD